MRGFRRPASLSGPKISFCCAYLLAIRFLEEGGEDFCCAYLLAIRFPEKGRERGREGINASQTSAQLPAPFAAGATGGDVIDDPIDAPSPARVRTTRAGSHTIP